MQQDSEDTRMDGLKARAKGIWKIKKKRLVGERWSNNSLHIVSFICKGSFAEGSLRFFVMTSRCIDVRALRVPSSGDTELPALLASRCGKAISLILRMVGKRTRKGLTEEGFLGWADSTIKP